MKIIKVSDKKTKKEFLKTAKELYKNDNIWVCPLDNQIEKVFDPEENKFYKNGEVTRWILKNEDNKLIGRIAAFIDKEKAFGFEQPTGGIGFFECINDKKAAFLLFDTAKNWLQERDMKAMDGPINFGENDNFWGLLVDGFTHPGIGMQYNPPYYKELFEEYGFTFYFEQVSNHLDLTKPFPERFWKIAEWVASKPDFTFEHISFKNVEKYINNLIDIYNTAWKFHENFSPFTYEKISKTFSDLKPIIVEEFIWFAYHKEEPIAFLIMLPDTNQIIKHLNGKLNFFNKLKFLYLKWKKTITRTRIVIMGVKPKFQKSGVESAIFWNMEKVMKKMPHITEMELSWVGDFNPKMRALHESVGATFAKKHVTYRCLFDKDTSTKRSTIIPVDTKEKELKEKQNNKKQKKQ